MNKVLFSGIVGGMIFVLSNYLYLFLKKQNGGKAHFPFEKVAIPMIALVLTSAAFYFITK